MVLSLIAGGTVAYVINLPGWEWIAGVCLLLLMLLWLLYRSVAKPLDTVENGYGLLLSQDFNSRLLEVGEYHADKAAKLFNRMASELRKERLRLSEQECFLKQLVEVSPMGVAVLDFDYKVTMVNRAFLNMAEINSEGTDLEGIPMKDIDSELVKRAMKVVPGESETVRMSDTRIYRISNLWFMESGFRRPFILIESLTKEVAKAERMAYEKVIRVISHEVNNTMGGIASLLEILADTSEDEEMRMAVESGEERCRSLSNFIRKYAEVVKLSDPVISHVDIKTEITRIAPFLRTITGSDVELELQLPDEDIEIKVDPLMWEQVLINLVKNADESVRSKISAGAAGDDACSTGVDAGTTREDAGAAGEYEGKVTVAAYRDDAGHVSVEVIDNGSGISPETAQRLFTPSSRPKPTARG